MLPNYFKLNPTAKEQFCQAWKVTLETRARSREDCDGHRLKIEEPLKEVKQGSAFMRAKTLISELPFVLRATDMPEKKRHWYCLIVLLNALQTMYTSTSFDATTWNMAPLLESYGMKLRDLLHACDDPLLSATTMKIHRIVYHLPSVVSYFGPLRFFWAQESEGSFMRHKDIYASMSGQKSFFSERIIKAETLHEASLKNKSPPSGIRGPHMISTLHIGDFVMSHGRRSKKQSFWEIVDITKENDETFFHGIPWEIHSVDSEMYHYPVLRRSSKNENLCVSLSDLSSCVRAVPTFPDFSSPTLQLFARTHPPIHTTLPNSI